MIITRRLAGAPVVAALRRQIGVLMEGSDGGDGTPPVLATVAVGLDDASASYRGSIERTCAKVGIDHLPVDLPISTDAASVVATILRLNRDASVTGILVFMPLPAHLPGAVVLDTLDPLKDIDGITPISQGRLRIGLPTLQPSCPLGGIELLVHHGVAIAGAATVVIGRSPVVGGPLATMLTHRDATVTTAHRRTRDIGAITRCADLICLAAGSPGLLTAEMVDSSATVLDFGTTMVEGTMRGDADYGGLAGHVAALSPVPGGTGPVTAYTLARNVCFARVAQGAGTLDATPDPDLLRHLEAEIASHVARV